MKVNVSMTADKDEFRVYDWWATSADFVVDSLRRQLEAAAAIWPELSGYKIDKPRSRSKAERGTTGGHARAAALSPESRSEIASEAAKARWGNNPAPDAAPSAVPSRSKIQQTPGA